MENLQIYLESLTKLAFIYNDLTRSELSYCKISIERANAAIRDAQSKLQTAFHDWLLAASQISRNEEGEARPSHISSECLSALTAVVKFFESDKTQFSAVLDTWIEVRSNYLATYCEPFFVAAQTFEKKAGTYAKGSHPIAQAFKEAIQLLEVKTRMPKVSHFLILS